MITIVGVAALALVAINWQWLTSEGTSLANAGADQPLTYQPQGSDSRPTPAPSASLTPLGKPQEPPASAGKYAFLSVQPGVATPVAYDPCRPIRYVVNPAAEPPGAEGLLDEAIGRISIATGLTFENLGPTVESPPGQREMFQPALYGDAWAPVLVWWTTPAQAPLLNGDVAGFAGSASIPVIDDFGGEGPTVYVSGQVALDGPQLADVLSHDEGGRAAARAVILHELGHLVGLGHVNDSTQIMNPVGSHTVTEYSSDDLTGLNQLGRGQCVPEL